MPSHPLGRVFSIIHSNPIQSNRTQSTRWGFSNTSIKNRDCTNHRRSKSFPSFSFLLYWISLLYLWRGRPPTWFLVKGSIWSISNQRELQINFYVNQFCLNANNKSHLYYYFKLFLFQNQTCLFWRAFFSTRVLFLFFLQTYAFISKIAFFDSLDAFLIKKRQDDATVHSKLLQAPLLLHWFQRWPRLYPLLFLRSHAHTHGDAKTNGGGGALDVLERQEVPRSKKNQWNIIRRGGGTFNPRPWRANRSRAEIHPHERPIGCVGVCQAQKAGWSKARFWTTNRLVVFRRRGEVARRLCVCLVLSH